ncbi:hypothetical protein [Pseudopedobacter beijingensis]|uniref:DUF3299 domain-containing protein n=1 Tax=Pseudopedobacter beijingensis TaxID=1207056 RepID=A0ABW4I8Q1_9SPHI
MKKVILSLFLFFYGNVLLAQAPDHTPMMNKYWEILNTRTIKKASSGSYEPYYPAPLSALDQKQIYLSGYIVPIKTGTMHKTFLLSVLPIAQCQFCGEGDIPEMVEVFMEEPIKYTTKPIVVEGTLKINKELDGASFQLQKTRLKK